jgi:hypothetical protein
VRYELGFYIPEDGVVRSHRRESLQSYIELTFWAIWRRRNVFPVGYELGFYIPDDILHSHRSENLKFYIYNFPSGFSSTTNYIPSLPFTNL